MREFDGVGGLIHGGRRFGFWITQLKEGEV
jgi:hypothetical protein